MTLKLTIDHIVFYLEQEAFTLLHNYLEYLILTNTSSSLAMKEEQMAGYFLSKLSEGNQVNTLGQVEHIIKRLEAERSITIKEPIVRHKSFGRSIFGTINWGVN